MESTHEANDIMRLNTLRATEAKAILRGMLPGVRRHLPAAMSALLGLLIAWILAQLTWVVLPRPQHAAIVYASPSATRAAFDVGNLVNMHIFGRAPTAGLSNTPETTLNLTLRGIVAANSDNRKSLAIITSGGVEQLYAVGAQLPGGAQILSIYPDHVLLTLNGVTQALRLPKSAGAASTGNGAMLPPAMPSVVYGRTLPAVQNLDQLRNELVSHPERLLDVVRALPVEDNRTHRLIGYRVFPVGNSDAFAKLGLKPGDVVTAVNGMPLDNPAESMRILSSVKTSEQISITLLRNGQQQTQILQMQKPGD